MFLMGVALMPFAMCAMPVMGSSVTTGHRHSALAASSSTAKLVEEEEMCIVCVGKALDEMSAAYGKCVEGGPRDKGCVAYGKAREKVSKYGGTGFRDAETIYPAHKADIKALHTVLRAQVKLLDGMQEGCSKDKASCSATTEFKAVVKVITDDKAVLNTIKDHDELEARRKSAQSLSVLPQPLKTMLSTRNCI